MFALIRSFRSPLPEKNNCAESKMVYNPAEVKKLQDAMPFTWSRNRQCVHHVERPSSQIPRA